MCLEQLNFLFSMATNLTLNRCWATFCYHPGRPEIVYSKNYREQRYPQYTGQNYASGHKVLYGCSSGDFTMSNDGQIYCQI